MTAVTRCRRAELIEERIMKKSSIQRPLFAVMVSALVLGALGGYPSAKGSACQAISTVWTIASTYIDGTTANRIYSDGLGNYVDGGSGVTASIKACSTSDAVLIVGSGRQLDFNLTGALLAGQPPAWTSNGPFASSPPRVKNCSGSPCTLLNIQNV